MFYKIDNPPQWMLDGLMSEEKKGKCPDCQTDVDQPHKDGCDVARCLKTGIQRLQCGCGKCGDDIWTGLWPGVQMCYEEKLVCFDTATSTVCFDINAAVIRKAIP